MSPCVPSYWPAQIPCTQSATQDALGTQGSFLPQCCSSATPPALLGCPGNCLLATHCLTPMSPSFDEVASCSFFWSRLLALPSCHHMVMDTTLPMDCSPASPSHTWETLNGWRRDVGDTQKLKENNNNNKSHQLVAINARLARPTFWVFLHTSSWYAAEVLSMQTFLQGDKPPSGFTLLRRARVKRSTGSA